MGIFTTRNRLGKKLDSALFAVIALFFLLTCFSRPAFGAAIQGKEEGSIVSYCKSIDFTGASQTLTNVGLDCTLNSTAVGGVSDIGDLSDVGTADPTVLGNILVADGTNFEGVTMSGLVTLDAAGVARSGTMTNTKWCITDGTIINCTEDAPASVLDDLSDIGTAGASTLANILVSDGTDFEGVAMSGAATIDSTGSLDLSDFGTFTDGLGRVLVNDGSDFESVEMTGDVTIDSAGVTYYNGQTGLWTDLTPNLEPNDDGDGIQLNDATGNDNCVIYHDGTDLDINCINTTQIEVNVPIKVAGGTSQIELVDNTLGNVLVADGSGFLSQTMSGDATIGSTGILNLLDDQSTLGNVLVSDGTDLDSVAMSGDATISSAGAIAVVDDSHAHTTTTVSGLTSADITLASDDLSDFGTVDESVIGDIIVADGDSWESVTMSGDATINASGAINLLDDQSTLGNILVSDGTNMDSVAMSGDVTIDSAGATTIQADSISLADLSDIDSATATTGNILVADGNSFESVAMSGDFTIDASGVSYSRAGASYSAGATEYIFLDDTHDASTAAGGYTKAKEYLIVRGGTIRVDMTFAVSGGSSAQARVYRNGVAVGSEQSHTTSDTSTEDISGWSAGDLLQVYIKTTGGGTCQFTNLALYSTVPTLEYLLQLDTSGALSPAYDKIPTSSGTTGGTGSGCSGNTYVDLMIDGVRYKVCHDGTL